MLRGPHPTPPHPTQNVTEWYSNIRNATKWNAKILNGIGILKIPPGSNSNVFLVDASSWIRKF
jgi:hypothetical protein